MNKIISLTIVGGVILFAGCVGAEVDTSEDDGNIAGELTSNSYVCGEASCVPLLGTTHISHYTGANCTGTESYYTPYDSGTTSPNPDGKRSSWDGLGIAGTIYHTQTNRSYRASNGVCVNAWPYGNTLPYFVTIYRTVSPCPAGFALRTGVWYYTPGLTNYWGTTYASSACVGNAAPISCTTAVDPITGRIDGYVHSDYQLLISQNPYRVSGQIEDVCEDPANNSYILIPPCSKYLILQPGVDQCADVTNIKP
jgi:hypothetical protein